MKFIQMPKKEINIPYGLSDLQRENISIIEIWFAMLATYFKVHSKRKLVYLWEHSNGVRGKSWFPFLPR